MPDKTFLFAGGGSGGHISPGLAVAERLLELDPQVKCIFACSNRTIDKDMLTQAQAKFEPLPATGFSPHPLALLRFVINNRKSRSLATQIIKEKNVSEIVSMGGFVSAPVVAAAKSCSISSTLVNLDDPPGKANRWIARKCDRVLLATEVRHASGFDYAIVGMPIRRNCVADDQQAICKSKLELDPDKFTLLVTGASQGATSINKFMATFAKSISEKNTDWQIYHLAGHGSASDLKSAYEQANLLSKVDEFQTNMGLAWGAADLAISRSGASSVAEAWANAVPTVFMPYPYHRDDHQRLNAQPMVDIGGAAIETDRIDAAENVNFVGKTILKLMADENKRSAMRRNLVDNEPKDAALVIAKILLGMD
ncbi:MAG: UDP-N-acetylglucosamine--N-acetylmuramyl-(pentapeptide) pyrophosphoryl-undecaprenol N-acetylglucosamine transferase [Planctomycetes bacterium]|nr:UDP-N-acetylglucosamine--N-acetylmuramyl-(pentapeptide) pyrophosphoryl-undecaprenol N-acetylglucosamine transferase [Planctomycetota bacterium]